MLDEKTNETSIFHASPDSFTGPLIIGTFEKRAPGSALGEKGEKIGVGERKNQRAKRAWEVVWWGERVAFPPPQLHRWACFACRYFSCLTPFLAFFPPLRSLVPGYNNPKW